MSIPRCRDWAIEFMQCLGKIDDQIPRHSTFTRSAIKTALTNT